MFKGEKNYLVIRSSRDLVKKMKMDNVVTYICIQDDWKQTPRRVERHIWKFEIRY